MAKHAIAKTGNNIPDITDERNFIFTTDLDYLKEEQSGVVDTDVNGDVTITHNLNYVPAFTVFLADFSDTSIWYPNLGAEIYANSTQIVVNGALTGIKSKVFYLIYSSEL